MGSLGDESCLPKLLTVREDDLGQVVDVELFCALGKLGASGIESLRGFLTHSQGSVRQLALNAFLRADEGSLAGFADILAQDSDESLRKMAFRKLPVSIELVRQTAENDVDPDVRVEAINSLLGRCQSNGPALQAVQPKLAIDSVSGTDVDLLLHLLKDNSAKIRSSALNALLVLAVPHTFEACEISLSQAFLNDDFLPVDRADMFVDVLGSTALEILGSVSGNDSYPSENRLVAIKAMINLKRPLHWVH